MSDVHASVSDVLPQVSDVHPPVSDIHAPVSDILPRLPPDLAADALATLKPT
ncbi:hypothetical protein GMD78_13870 [Ornithinibacillus sp. L9]|uniref:Uncharacterized protein n=1 Tax=Ornithinibacillus caprae TaxID=2678566 RepID=A0A6N8FIM2_9BACI|nr:hypothetical protein [Ornithinibacillus caprae]